MSRTTVITPEQIADHLTVLSDWVKANGLDPCDIPIAYPIVVRQPRTPWGRATIRYREYRRSPQGQLLVDPDGMEAWTRPRRAPCTAPPPALPEAPRSTARAT